LFDWSDAVSDIREHFPLDKYKMIVDDTVDLNGRYFVDRKTGEPYILSTTFLLTTENELKAQAVTYSGKLERPSTLEKLERERILDPHLLFVRSSFHITQILILQP